MDDLLERQGRALERLFRLRAAPPAGLLLEGGSEAEREAMAVAWAMLLNCQAPTPEGGCAACAPCVQLAQRASRDLLFFDWRGGPWDGAIAELREARRIMGETPREGPWRVIVLFEAHGMRDEHANLLLKSIEEPGPGNVFVLTTPQRERILPTLVSRSFVTTLAWPPPGAELAAPLPGGEGDVAELARAFYGFLTTGRGLFGLTGGRGRLSKLLADRLVLLLQRDLAQALKGAPEAEGARLLAGRLDLRGLRRLDAALLQAKDSLDAKVNPSLVVDWLATSLRFAGG